jgi:hypothetical protein
MFLAKFLVVLKVANCDGGRRYRSNRVGRAIEGIISGRGGVGD